jgi:hypothetical protein
MYIKLNLFCINFFLAILGLSKFCPKESIGSTYGKYVTE